MNELFRSFGNVKKTNAIKHTTQKFTKISAFSPNTIFEIDPTQQILRRIKRVRIINWVKSSIHQLTKSSHYKIIYIFLAITTPMSKLDSTTLITKE